MGDLWRVIRITAKANKLTGYWTVSHTAQKTWKLLCSKVFKTEVSDPLLLSGCSPTESRSSVLVNTVVQYFVLGE